MIFHRKLLVYLSFFSHCLQLDREILLYSLILGDFPVYSYVLPVKILHVLIVFLCFPTFFPGFSRLSRRKRSPFLVRLSPPGFGLAGAPPQEALRATKALDIHWWILTIPIKWLQLGIYTISRQFPIFYWNIQTL